jgi:hypothetical protein
MGHYRMKKQQQFEPARDRAGREEKACRHHCGEGDMGEKWDNSTSQVMQKTVKELEEMEKDLDREFAASQQEQPQQDRRQSQRSGGDHH